MPICKACGEEADELIEVRAAGKKARLCEDCAEQLEHEDQMAEESEAVIQRMMGFKGRRE